MQQFQLDKMNKLKKKPINKQALCIIIPQIFPKLFNYNETLKFIPQAWPFLAVPGHVNITNKKKQTR